MIFGVILDPDEQEEKLIQQYLRGLTAHYTDEKLEIKAFYKNSLFLKKLESVGLLDVAIIDVTRNRALESARLIRKKFPDAEILVIADLSMSPMKYMHPSIRASSLLLRPAVPGWESALRDFFEQFLRANRRDRQKNVLWVENRNGTFRIPFEQIYYLEAREKKVFIRTELEELAVSGTIEKFAVELPGNFARCHRSFIVNTDYIVRIKFSENMLYLRENLLVPISRSYREVFKRRANE